MRTFLAGLIPVAFLLALLAVPAGPTHAADSWQRFHVAGRQFSVLMPKTPEAKSAPVSGNSAVMEYDYLADMGTTAYQVTELVFGPGTNVPVADDAYWTRVVNGYAQGSGSVVRTQRYVTFAGTAGVEALTDDPKEDLHHRIDMILVGNRLYIIAAAGPGEFASSNESIRFFNSFRLTQ